MARHPYIGLIGGKTGLTGTSGRGLAFVPDEGLVCPRRGSRLSPTKASFVPHEKPVGDKRGNDVSFVNIFINTGYINRTVMKRIFFTLTLILGLTASHAQEPLTLSPAT